MTNTNMKRIISRWLNSSQYVFSLHQMAPTSIHLKELLMRTKFDQKSLKLLLQRDEKILELISSFVEEQWMNGDNKDDGGNKKIPWHVSVEFTPTSIMSHLKPIDIICITPDELKEIAPEMSPSPNDDMDDEEEEDEKMIDGYVIVLFEQGVISSYMSVVVLIMMNIHQVHIYLMVLLIFGWKHLLIGLN